MSKAVAKVIPSVHQYFAHIFALKWIPVSNTVLARDKVGISHWQGIGMEYKPAGVGG